MFLGLFLLGSLIGLVILYNNKLKRDRKISAEEDLQFQQKDIEKLKIQQLQLQQQHQQIEELRKLNEQLKDLQNKKTNNKK